jgi:hypothetical protein
MFLNTIRAVVAFTIKKKDTSQTSDKQFEGQPRKKWLKEKSDEAVDRLKDIG